jgi:hypothetical protein
MNPLVLFLPAYRASRTAYVLGLVLLAAIDAVRMSFAGQVSTFVLVLVLALAMGFFVLSLHINRLRYVGRGGGLGVLPVLAGWVVSFVAAFAGWMGGYMEAVRQHLAANGNDTSDEVVLEALQDPAFQQEIQRAMQSDPELGMTVLAAGAWPSYFGFWLVIALFAVWFALMKPRQPAG